MFLLISFIVNISCSFNVKEYLIDLNQNDIFKGTNDSSTELIHTFESIINKANNEALDLEVISTNGEILIISKDQDVLRFEKILNEEMFNFNILYSFNYTYAQNEKDVKFIEVIKFINTRFNKNFHKFETLLEKAKIINTSLALLIKDIIGFIALSKDIKGIKNYKYEKINNIDLAFMNLEKVIEAYNETKIYLACTKIEKDLVQELLVCVGLYSGSISKQILKTEIIKVNKFITDNEFIN